MADVTVKLPDPVETHGGMVSVAILRPPTTRMYFEFGDPQQWVRDAAGNMTMMDNSDAIYRYLERCVREPIDSIILGTMSLANGLVLREALLGFFVEARVRTSPAPSSSSALTSDGSTPAASAA